MSNAVNASADFCGPCIETDTAPYSIKFGYRLLAKFEALFDAHLSAQELVCDGCNDHRYIRSLNK